MAGLSFKGDAGTKKTSFWTILCDLIIKLYFFADIVARRIAWVGTPTPGKLTHCELLFPFQPSLELVVAKGKVWPSVDRILHGRLLNEKCVKVQVDTVIKGCEKTRVLDVTRADEISYVGDMLHNFVQWPRETLKLMNEALNPISSQRVASPQIDDLEVTTEVVYIPQQVEELDEISSLLEQQYEVGPMGFVNMLKQIEERERTQMPTTISRNIEDLIAPNIQDPDPKFIDPEIEIEHVDNIEVVKVRTYHMEEWEYGPPPPDEKGITGETMLVGCKQKPLGSHDRKTSSSPPHHLSS
ncbi:hypothetical protein E3N88_09551 [Mikania micrantha]|uniref:DUF8039 domain-containing protein n=1 Tax=Mikania micrantha TaxID=192012 RepID=A0A5N6PMG5_9ASTR|nr:hypothetical protein E3N88_09551 [Mikania micrantha]